MAGALQRPLSGQPRAGSLSLIAGAGGSHEQTDGGDEQQQHGRPQDVRLLNRLMVRKKALPCAVNT